MSFRRKASVRRRPINLKFLTLERRDVPTNGVPGLELGPLNISKVEPKAVSDCTPLVADPALRATGPFIVPPQTPILFGNPGGGPAGPFSPLPITWTTNASGLPQLTSSPSSAVAIYLDFDGEGANAPYDNDNNFATFSLAEQQTIVECWRQISIYYSMFDVNVTTVKPGAGVPMCWQLISNSISGGYAFVGAFPNSQPQGFNQGSDARTRVSGIAHEIGHNFVLSHQSDYDTLGVKTAEYSSGYALHGPIMGVDYAQNVHKFILNHPSYSASQLQDDLQAIANEIKVYLPAGSDGFRPDDHGNTTALSTPMALDNGYFGGWGTIERLTDVDMFSFTSTGGTYGIYANANTPSSLDTKIEVLDSSGKRLATVDPTNSNDANVVMNLPAGAYYIAVSSHGDYADLGVYHLSVRSLPSGWSSQDIGTVVTGGFAGVDNATGAWRVSGSGDDIWNSNDAFRFAYVPLTGDGSITARVTGIEDTNANAKVGVIMRESTASNSKNAFMMLKPGSAAFQYRTSTGGTTAQTTASAVAPYWVRLSRSGNSITAQISADGVAWSTVGTQSVSMTSQILVGLAVTSHNNSHYDQVNDATFDNLTLTGAIGPTAPTFNALPAPSNLIAALGSGTAIDVSWDAVAGATGYAVDRSADGVNWTLASTTAALNYTTSGLAGGNRCFFRVAALDGSTRSVPSDWTSIVNRPDAVTNFEVTSLSTSQLVLDWREVGGETGYRIERSTDGGTTWSSVATVGKNVPSYANTSLGYATTYSYRVIPTSDNGDGPASAVVTTSTRLNAVAGLAITSVASNQIVLNWNTVTSATGYRIQRSSDGTNFTNLITVSTPGYVDATVSPLTEYYYRVAAVNQYSESVSQPNVFAATPPATPIGSPWTNADIGSVGGRGAAGLSSSTFTLIAAGATIGGTNDSLHFVSQPFTGDGVLVGRVASVEDTGTSARVGIMIRDTLAANSRMIFLGSAPTNATGISFSYRASAGGTATTTNTVSQGPLLYFRLTRTGNIFTAERSPDGLTWTGTGSVTIAMGSTTYAGLAVVSGDNSKLNRSTLNSVSLTQASLPPRVLQSTPNGPATSPISFVDIEFTKPMDQTSFSVANDILSATGPAGSLLGQITGYSWNSGTSLRVNFNPQTLPGNYAIAFGPNILSTNGQQLDQDNDGTPGEANDGYSVSFKLGRPTDAFGYAWGPTTYDAGLTLTPGSPGVFTLGGLSSTDDSNAALNLGPNTFRFYGTQYSGATSLFVGSNGVITIGTGTNDHINLDLTATPTQQTIAPLWDDLVTSRNTTTDDLVLYQFRDTDGNGQADRLVINWRNVHYWQQSYTSGDDGINFQTVLEINTGARSGDIVFNYVDLSELNSGAPNNGGSATVGIKDVGTQGGNRVLISQNGSGASNIAAGKAVRLFVNQGPTAKAGGPYSVLPDGNVALNGLTSSDPDQTAGSLIYLWDLDGDGEFGEFGAAASRGDEINGTPTFKATGLTAPSAVNVALRVIDEFGVVSTDSAVINVVQPPSVQATVVGDGSAQRSQVNQLTVNFDSLVTLPADPTTAFTLIGPGGAVPFIATVTNGTATSVTIDTAQLPDGLYTLTAISTAISANGAALDGNGDGTGGDDFTFNFHRLFGDSDGDRDVDIADFAAFRGAFSNTSNLSFDSDGDSDVDLNDFSEFRVRFGTSI